MPQYKTVFSLKIENTSAIANGAIWQPLETQLSEADILKHGHFNSLTVFNNSDVDIEIRLNGTNVSDKGVENLPAGGTMVWNVEEGINFQRPAVLHKGEPVTTDIATNKLIFQIRKLELMSNA